MAMKWTRSRLVGGLCAAVTGVVAVGVLAASGPAAPLTVANTAPGKPTGLTVGDRPHPLNVEGAPQFGWLPQDADGNEVQTAYQIEVTRDSDGATVWDSGKVASSDESYVPYAGPALEHGTSYSWVVRTWDRYGQVSPWSAPAHPDTGIADPDWDATWIRRLTSGADSTVDYTFARKQFTLSDPGSPVVRARIYTSAMGEYELHVNGQATYRGDSFDYPGEGQYAVNDITEQARQAQQAGGAAANQLAVGMLAYYHTCTCQGRANGPPTNSTTLAVASVAGDTAIHTASVTGYVAGDVITVDTGASAETRTIAAVGTAGAAGTGITLASALALPHASGASAVSSNGPSGLLVRVVADHADGTRDVFVSDGTWKVTKDTAQTNSTITYRNSDAGDRVEFYDARLEIPGWDTVGFDDNGWQNATVIGPHPRPASATQDRFTHLEGNVSGISYETLHPVSVKTLADGTVIADFGKVTASAPQIHFHNGASGRALTIQTSYRLVNTTLAADAAAGDTVIKVASVSGLVAGDAITVDAAGVGNPEPNPEQRTIVSVGTAGAAGTGVTLDTALTQAHASGKYVEGTRAGTSSTDTQGSNMTWSYTQKDGDQKAEAFTYWAWRYLQINAPGPGETLTADDITALHQHTDAPPDRLATFSSDNATLDRVFELMQRSGLDTSQETMVDTPTREKGQFLGDSVDISFGTMLSAGERTATKRAIREFVYSGTHVWKSTSSGYCTSAPCSYPGYGSLSAGRLNAVYPNGDNMRDIPDYTEFFPDLVWRYYLLSGDRATLASAYATMKNAADYVHAAQPSTGAATGLTWLLPGGSGSYQNGIIDWPSRFGYVFTGNGARTIHAEEAVAAYRFVAKAAELLGNSADAATYGGYAEALTDAIHAKQQIAGDTLYSDGLAVASSTLSAATAVGATNIKVATVAPFTVGDTIAIDYANGANKEVRTITSVGTAGAAGTGIDLDSPLAKTHASNATVSVSTATQVFPAATTLAADAVPGDATLKVASVTGFTASASSEANAGPTLIVGTGADREIRTIADVGTAGADGTGITLSSPLTRAHASGVIVASPSQQAQAFGIYSGVAPKADWSSLAGYIAAQGLRTAPMDWGVTVQALGMADRPDALVDFMTNRDRFGPGQVLAENGTFMWEDWFITGNNSFSHGWGARGITALMEYLLGVSVTSPGAATVLIAPPDRVLRHADGTEWTQRGTVRVTWTRVRGDHVVLNVRVPVNVRATVSLPDGDAATYVASGNGAAQFVGVQDGRAVFTVGSGQTHFVMHGDQVSGAQPNGEHDS